MTPNQLSDYKYGRCVVVGGGSGIGLEVVRQAHEQSESMTVIDLSVEEPDELSALTNVNYLHGNVLDAAVLQENFAGAAEEGPISNVFVSAGVAPSSTIDSISSADAERCLMINLMGSVNTVQAALPHVANDASIVLCASVAAYVGGGLVGGSVYAASKAGVIGLTRGAARELADRGIRVNCVVPGATSTGMVGDEPELVKRLSEMTLLKRLATPDEIGSGVLFLWSQASSYITGASLDINGGSHLG